ncbi:hypothetical protein BGZ52_007646, partial [Haplosporangium bisporale]
MGIPDVWQNEVPTDDPLDTTCISPHLVPTPRPTPQDEHSIGWPYNVQHKAHVDIDVTGSGKVGLKGLPNEWKAVLEEQGISEQEIKQHPQALQKLMQLQLNDLELPPPSRPPPPPPKPLPNNMPNISPRTTDPKRQMNVPAKMDMTANPRRTSSLNPAGRPPVDQPYPSKPQFQGRPPAAPRANSENWDTKTVVAPRSKLSYPPGAARESIEELEVFSQDEQRFRIIIQDTHSRVNGITSLANIGLGFSYQQQSNLPNFTSWTPQISTNILNFSSQIAHRFEPIANLILLQKQCTNTSHHEAEYLATGFIADVTPYHLRRKSVKSMYVNIPSPEGDRGEGEARDTLSVEDERQKLMPTLSDDVLRKYAIESAKNKTAIIPPLPEASKAIKGEGGVTPNYDLEDKDDLDFIKEYELQPMLTRPRPKDPYDLYADVVKIAEG